MLKVREVEITRTNISPKQFFTYCKKQMKKHGADMADWCESYDDFANPRDTWSSVNKHEDWETPRLEIVRTNPFDMQFYLKGTYNFIMEFQFDEKNKGTGYLYTVEFKS